jgi:hypothetical protein
MRGSARSSPPLSGCTANEMQQPPLGRSRRRTVAPLHRCKKQDPPFLVADHPHACCRAHFIETTARPFLPHPRHRRRPLRSRTFVARLNPSLCCASGVGNWGGPAFEGQCPSKGQRRFEIRDPRTSGGNLVEPDPGGSQMKHFARSAHWHLLCRHPLPRGRSRAGFNHFSFER